MDHDDNAGLNMLDALEQETVQGEVSARGRSNDKERAALISSAALGLRRPYMVAKRGGPRRETVARQAPPNVDARPYDGHNVPSRRPKASPVDTAKHQRRPQ